MKAHQYKNNEFSIRENSLGIGKVIQELATKYEDDLAIAQLHIIKMPDYLAYSEIIRTLTALANDQREHKELLAVTKDKAKIKEIKKIIDTCEKALQQEYDKLSAPVMDWIFKRVTAIRKEVYFGFINDTETVKTLADTLLIGDTSVINYAEPDEDLEKLRDVLFEVFFSLKNRIYSQQTKF